MAGKPEFVLQKKTAKKRPFLKLSTIFLSAFLFAQCQTDSGKTKFVLTNNSAIELSDKAISVKRSQLGEIPEGEILKWQGIQVTQEIAKSNNTKVIIIGTGEDGLPIILNAAK